MISIEEVGTMLDAIADELPQAFYKDLSGGILLLPEAKLHPEHQAHDLYILGEYHYDQMGRYIIIYYGSFARLFKGLSLENLREKLKDTLLHEFTHHIESLAGKRELEVKDAQEMARYRYGQRQGPYRFKSRGNKN